MSTVFHLFSHLLDTNSVPDHHEMAFIQLEIDCMQNALAQLERHGRELQGQLQQFRSILSPVRKLPVEILGEIFSFAISSPLDSIEREHLINFALVCRTWRDAAYRKHILWSSLRIEGELTQSSYDLILSCFGRSGCIPRSLELDQVSSRINCGDSGCRSSSRWGTLLLAKLLTEGPVLHALAIHFDRLDCFRNLLAAFQFFEAKDSAQRPWDSIKSLGLGFVREWNEHPDPAKSVFLSIPSNVTEFQLSLPEFDEAWSWQADLASENASLHLTQDLLGRLNSFLLSCDWRGPRLLSHLPFCSKIETLTLDFKHWAMRCHQTDEFLRGISDTGILLPKVRTLRLQNILSKGISILQFLNTPSLEHLDIDFTDEDEFLTYHFSQQVEAFIKNKSRCEATFRSLSLRRCTVARTGNLAPLLMSLPSLTHVTLDNVSFDPELFEVFAEFARDHLGDGKSLSLPHLETLELLDLPHSFDSHHLLQFLMNRKGYEFHDPMETPIWRYPSDSMKSLVVTYKEVKQSRGFQGHREIELLRRNTHMSFSIGPLVYSPPTQYS